MSSEESQSKKSAAGGRTRKPSRKLSFRSRVRVKLRDWTNRVLGADLFWSGAFVVLVTVLLGSQQCGPSIGPLDVGEIASSDITAPADFYLVEEELTNERRREAREAVPRVYVYDSERAIPLGRALSSLFEGGRHALARASGEEGEAGEPERAVFAALAEQVSDEAALRALTAARFDEELEDQLKAILTRVMGRHIVANKKLVESEPAITLIRLPDREERLLSAYDGLTDLDGSRQAARDEVVERLMLSPDEERALAELLASFVDANVQPDPETTARRRQEAAQSVELVLIPVEEGQILIKQGERIDAETARSLNRLTRNSSGARGVGVLLALVLIASTLAFFIYRYTGYHQRRFRKVRHLHALLVLMVLVTLLLGEALYWLAGKVIGGMDAPFGEHALYIYLIPLGAGSILVALLANGRIAIVYSAFLALLFGAVFRWNAYLMVWAMLVLCGGVYAIATYRERAALLRAGLVVGGVGAAAAMAMETLQGHVASVTHMLYAAGLAFLGGAVGVGLLISFSLPLLERLFNVLTDIRLLELSNLNNPLLSEMAVTAPGSYNHSLVVGTLAEAGAKAIGASSLFCRVAAFYHDIGKMNKPDYYVENQRGHNPHDKLSPSMSALVIASHVKDGIRMAREAGLPEQLVDIIPQHHGTKLMTFFYEKARNSSDPSLGPIKEEDFRYPGPKPDTREAAIFMIADAAEAAARTVEDPTPNRLRDMIRKVTNSIVLDGQLDSCDLTFLDLKRVQEAFVRVLVSMYHRRVDYPGFEFNKRKNEAKSPDEATERKVVRGT